MATNLEAYNKPHALALSWVGQKCRHSSTGFCVQSNSQVVSRAEFSFEALQKNPLPVLLGLLIEFSSLYLEN